jgi:protein-disulfide isomerase
VFSDFECPYCGRFAREVLPIIEKEYVNPGRVELAFNHVPLAIHPNAIGGVREGDNR